MPRKNNRKKKMIIYSLAILASLFLAGLFLCKYIFWTGGEKKPEQVINVNTPKSNEQIEVSIEGNKLTENSSNFILSTTLKPTFFLSALNFKEIAGVRVDNVDLSDKLFAERGIIKQEKDGIVFSLPFLLKPGYHEFKIKLNKEDSIIEKGFSFNLGLKTDFTKSIDASEFFIIPDSTKALYSESWVVQDEKLRINALNKVGLASLAFLYPFSDIALSFELKPFGKNINLVFYFLDSGKSLVIGNGNNRRITLLQGKPCEDNSIEGEPFEFTPGRTYSVFILRQKNVYSLYIKEGISEDISGENIERIKESHPLLVFEDTDCLSVSEDSVGFSAWTGSDGLEIDNLNIFGAMEYER